MDSERPFTCVTCGKGFTTNRYLLLHIRTHSEVRPFECFECGKKFKRKEHLTRHINSHKKETLLPFVCSVEECKKEFKFERSLEAHVRKAHGTPYKCTFDGCDLAFNKKFKLRKHKATEHKAEVVLNCTYEGCTSTFRKKNHLTKHLRCHEREFKCRILGCDAVVKSWSELRKHIQGHKRIHCKVCDAVCPDQAMFKKHCSEVHPVEKKTKFECPYDGCSKVYSRGSNLNSHIRNVHDGRRFHCEVEGCGKKFRHNFNLKAHLVTHENPNKKPKKKRKRKSIAAKLARYNGEFCDLPVTYVEQDGRKVSATLSLSGKTPHVSRDCSNITTESSSGREAVLDTLCEEYSTLCKESSSNIPRREQVSAAKLLCTRSSLRKENLSDIQGDTVRPEESSFHEQSSCSTQESALAKKSSSLPEENLFNIEESEPMPDCEESSSLCGESLFLIQGQDFAIDSEERSYIGEQSPYDMVESASARKFPCDEVSPNLQEQEMAMDREESSSSCEQSSFNIQKSGAAENFLCGESSCNVQEREPALDSLDSEDSSFCEESMPVSLMKRLQVIIRDSNSHGDSRKHFSEPCSSERTFKTHNSLSKERPPVLKCAASS